jgi:uncharacterized protein YwgA
MTVKPLFIELMVLKAVGEIERTRLQKTMFVLQEEYGIPLNLTFERYFYGPHSEQLTQDLEVLKAFGIIEERRVFSKGFVYRLSEKGEKLLGKINDAEIRELHVRIEELMKALNNIPTKELVERAKKNHAC